MRTFVQQPKAARLTAAAKPTIPGRTHLGRNRNVHSILDLQRRIRNQAVQGPLEASTGVIEEESTTAGLARFGHDFSRIPVWTKAPVQLSGKLNPTANETLTSSAPHAVDSVLRAPGHRLDEQTRDFFETRFGCDFSRVRVHTDASAASSADALNARAYTVSHDVVFGRNEYVPESKSGRSLLAHELAHVAQQQKTTASTDTRLEIGNPSDRAEQEAKASAQAALLAVPRHQKSDPLPGIAHLSGPSVCHRVLRRAPKDPTCTDEKNKTWAGCFDTEWYSPTRQEDGKKVRYGADIKIHFKPGKNVDAEKIALVQTAQSSEDNQPVSIYFRDAKTDYLSNPDVGPRIRGVAETEKSPKARETALSRMIDVLETGAGTAIDSFPGQRTPVAGMTDPDKGSELSGSGPTGYGQFGHRFKGDPKPEDATMRDIPGLIPSEHVEAHQIFETAAFAVAGAQKGAFYGSVQWGWNKSSSDDKATLLPFRLVNEYTPSSVFGEAAKLWNASRNTRDERSIPLPAASALFTVSKVALLDLPDKGKTLANLDINTRVEVTDEIDSLHKDWRNVIVVSEPSAGKVGWVKQESLSDRQTAAKRRGSGQK